MPDIIASTVAHAAGWGHLAHSQQIDRFLIGAREIASSSRCWEEGLRKQSVSRIFDEGVVFTALDL